jgi:hypothetical protein
MIGQFGQNGGPVPGTVLLPTIAQETPANVVPIVPLRFGAGGGADVPNSAATACCSVVAITPVRVATGVKFAEIRQPTSPSLVDIEPETLGGATCVPDALHVASPVVALSLATKAFASRSRIGIGHWSP